MTSTDANFRKHTRRLLYAFGGALALVAVLGVAFTRLQDAAVIGGSIIVAAWLLLYAQQVFGFWYRVGRARDDLRQGRASLDLAVRRLDALAANDAARGADQQPTRAGK